MKRQVSHPIPSTFHPNGRVSDPANLSGDSPRATRFHPPMAGGRLFLHREFSRLRLLTRSKAPMQVLTEGGKIVL